MASSIYKIKKAAAYIKHYGPDKLAKKAIGKLIDKDGYSEHFSELVSMMRSCSLREGAILRESR